MFPLLPNRSQRTLADMVQESQRQSGEPRGGPQGASLENHVRNHSDATPRASEMVRGPSSSRVLAGPRTISA